MHVHGLVQVFDTILPHADHRFCVRHMYANFKDKFKGKGELIYFKDKFIMQLIYFL